MFSIFFYLLQVKYINIHCEWGRGGIRCSVTAIKKFISMALRAGVPMQSLRLGKRERTPGGQVSGQKVT